MRKKKQPTRSTQLSSSSLDFSFLPTSPQQDEESSNKRVIDDDKDDEGCASSIATVIITPPPKKKKRRIQINDDDDDDEIDDDNDDDDNDRYPIDDDKEMRNVQRNLDVETDDDTSVLRLLSSSYKVIPTATILDNASIESIRFHPAKGRIILEDTIDCSSDDIDDDTVKLTTAPSVQAVLEECFIELNPILILAFEDGMLEVVMQKSSGGTVEVISLRLHVASCIKKISESQLKSKMTTPLIPIPRKLSGPYHPSYTLLQTLGAVFSGTIFDNVAQSLLVNKRKQQKVNDDQITAKMVYSVVDNKHSTDFDTDNQILTNSALNIPGLVPTLRPYQDAAVRWMLRRESWSETSDMEDGIEASNGDEWELCWYVVIECPENITWSSDEGCTMLVHRSKVIPLPEWNTLKSSIDEKHVFCNPFAGLIARSYTEARSMMLGNENEHGVAGGILAESMGLGKTVEVIACILANPSPLSLHSAVTAAGDDCTSNNAILPSHRGDKPSVLSDAICICGRSKSFVGCLSWVVCEGCGQEMHGRCAGFQSENEVICKTTYDDKCEVRICSTNFCPLCVTAAIAQNPASLIESRATLIVTPPAILVQWQKEISHHTCDAITGKPLKVLVYPGIKELGRDDFHLVHAQHLANADVVLVTYQTLMSEINHSDDNPFVSSANLRHRKPYVVLPSPLTNVKWWRICLDEAQRVEVPTAASARMARKLFTDRRWCVSGTPIGRGQLDDLYGLLLFLSLRPFDDKKVFLSSFVISHGHALERLSHLLKDLMWRSTKENNFVRRQMGIPDQEEKRVELHFSAVERYFYNMQYEITANAVDGLTNAKDSNWLQSLQKLRAACCHPQVGTSGLGGRVNRTQHIVSAATTVLSMDEILEKLIDDAKAKCEEAQRISILHTIGLAGHTNLKGNALDSSRYYQEALEIADKNAAPADVIGKANLLGSEGFEKGSMFMYNGAAKLIWRVDHIGKVWANIDFVNPKKISSLRIQNNLISESQGESPSKCTIIRPKKCILQMSSVSAGGGFVDVHTFSLVDDTTVQVVDGFRGKKSKCWRICIQSYHSAIESAGPSNLSSFYIGFDVKLFEPEIASDDLQRLHILHNLSRVLDTLRTSNDGEGKETAIATLNKMESEEHAIQNNYMSLAQAIHCQSKQQLCIAVEGRKNCEKELRELSEGTEGPWYDDVLSWFHLYGNDQICQALCEAIKYALTNHRSSGEGSTRSRSFPHFSTVEGLRAALSIRIQQGGAEVGLRRHSSKQNCTNQTIATIMKLSSSPADGEVYSNSHCQRCRSDWEQRGPVCSHCLLEDDLVKTQNAINDQEITCVLKSLSKFIKDYLAKAGKKREEYLGILNERAMKHSILQEKIRDEVSSAKSVWKAHFDLLSDIDELNQCKRSIRLRADGENVLALTKNEAAFIVDPENLSLEIMQHEVKQAAAMGQLRKSRSTLRYLKEQRRKQVAEVGATGQAVDINCPDTSASTCCICLVTLDTERSVLPCGHSFHTTCVNRLFKRVGQVYISCPMRCEMRVQREDILLASDKNIYDQSNKIPQETEIEGDWGTKITQILKDIKDVVKHGDKGVVFSQWDDMLSIVAEALRMNHILFIRPRSGKRFGEDIKQFRSSDCPMLLLNVKNSAEGLTLTEANHIFMVEPILNCGLDAQAINRIHRIGQMKKTYIHRYIVKDTIEEKIDTIRCEQLSEDNLQCKKKQLIKGGGIDGQFDASELSRLFG